MAISTTNYIFQTIIFGYPAVSFQRCTHLHPQISVPFVSSSKIRFATLQKKTASGHLRLDAMHELENAKLNPKVSGAEGGHCLTVVG